MATMTIKRRMLERRLRTVLEKLRIVGQALAEVGEDGVRASLLDAIDHARLAANRLHERAEELRSPRGPKTRTPAELLEDAHP